MFKTAVTAVVVSHCCLTLLKLDGVALLIADPPPLKLQPIGKIHPFNSDALQDLEYLKSSRSLVVGELVRWSAGPSVGPSPS